MVALGRGRMIVVSVLRVARGDYNLPAYYPAAACTTKSSRLLA
jgi:hypothetical protein